ncbi:MAG TPA: DUF885 family protein, partial [Longimicrobiales bacterium]|nr:DUF885 family protein [Longimicrobiales bacterium]
MPSFRPRRTLLVAVLAVLACEPTADRTGDPEVAAAPGTAGDLAALFDEWRDFERPNFQEGVPDYSTAAMTAQQTALPRWRARLDALWNPEWPVATKIDWHLVRAEMNGLDFDHRIRRPWARDPAFYVMIHTAESDVPAHEGAVIHGWIDTWTYPRPLSPQDARELAERVAAIPPLLDQARTNLTGDARDLWMAGIRSFHGQEADLAALRDELGGILPELDRALDEAAGASAGFALWLEQQAPSRTGRSGVGKENYTWYMQNVHLVPYSWEEQVTLMRRELARSHASLRLEENRNRNLPELERIGSAQEYDRRLNQSVDRYMRFLREEDVETVEPWMDPALRAVNGTFSPAAPGEIRNFFLEVIYRDPDAFRPHMHHWIELARMREAPHASPIRRVPSLYNIFDARSEGLATGVEEMFMHLGLLDDNSPRARELVWIMLAQRAARAVSGLMLHGNEFDMEEAVEFAGRWTPRGWLPDGELVRGEQQLYLRQPGYGTSYVT